MTSARHGGAVFRIPDLIIKKRDGHELTCAEIKFLVDTIVSKSIHDAQLGAMLMTIYLRGLGARETTSLTEAMKDSGTVLDWPEEWKGLVVDKHSTGGVGDKVSIFLAPALAACGVKVPMVSGRGLAHTGGTLDKLESMPGFRVSMNPEEMKHMLTEVGCCIVGQTNDLVPADKIMYAIRDVTGTTDCIGLIASSIMSKKIAESPGALVLDVKVGKGAFLQTKKEGEKLAKLMVQAGTGCGVKTVAMLTSMDAPLGRMVGNALEVAESLQCLHGDGPEELVDLAVNLGGQLLQTCGKATGVEEGRNMIRTTLQNGTALEKFCKMIKLQGVKDSDAETLCSKDADVFTVLDKASSVTELKSQKSGYVHCINAMSCAEVSAKLGAGREKVGDSINFAVGLELCKSVGEKVDEGDVWIKVHHNNGGLTPELVDALTSALIITSEAPKSLKKSRLIEIVT